MTSRNQTPKYHSAIIKAPFGTFKFCVHSLAEDASLDLKSAVNAELRLPFGSFALHELTTTDTLPDGLAASAKCTTSGEPWSWLSRIK